MQWSTDQEVPLVHFVGRGWPIGFGPLFAPINHNIFSFKKNLKVFFVILKHTLGLGTYWYILYTCITMFFFFLLKLKISIYILRKSRFSILFTWTGRECVTSLKKKCKCLHRKPLNLKMNENPQSGNNFLHV